MKISLGPRILAIASTVLLATSARSAVVLVIDVSNPLAVTITATPAFSQVTDSSSDTAAGVSLIDFFAADFSSSWPVSGNLAGPTGVPYNSAFTWAGGTNTLRDLNLYGGGGGTQNFSTSQAAFTGSGTTAMAGATFNSSGDVVVGDGVDGSGEIIGQYSIVPEPSAVLLYTFAGLAFLSRRVRR